MNFSCVSESLSDFNLVQSTVTLDQYQDWYDNPAFQNLTLTSLDPITGNTAADGSIQAQAGPCFNSTAVCRYVLCVYLYMYV